MESTTSEVVAGAEKAEDAGEALIRIESVSKDLSKLIEDISQEAQSQSETAVSDISGGKGHVTWALQKQAAGLKFKTKNMHVFISTRENKDHLKIDTY